jgi:threonine/homoserine/homoserine lactone efflux protein
MMWGGHMMPGGGYEGFMPFPFMFGILWIIAVVYVLYMGTRLVKTVEKIEERLGHQKEP